MTLDDNVNSAESPSVANTAVEVSEDEGLPLLVSLLKSGKYKEAKEKADGLINRGFDKRGITRICYEYFSVLYGGSREEAVKMAEVFGGDYGFSNWIRAFDEEQEKLKKMAHRLGWDK